MRRPAPRRPVQVMEADVWHIDEYRRALEDDEDCTPAEMARHFDKILARMRVDVMAHGNVAVEEAEGLVDTVAAALGRPEPLPEAELPTRHALKLPAAGDGEGAGSGVVVVDLQAKMEDEKNSAVQVGGLVLIGLLVVAFGVLFFLPSCPSQSHNYDALPHAAAVSHCCLRHAHKAMAAYVELLLSFPHIWLDPAKADDGWKPRPEKIRYRLVGSSALDAAGNQTVRTGVSFCARTIVKKCEHNTTKNERLARTHARTTTQTKTGVPAGGARRVQP